MSALSLQDAISRTGRLADRDRYSRTPYVIFHDATLREMARLRLTSIDALLAVKGVGARKADDLGETFLAAIRGHSSWMPLGLPRPRIYRVRPSAAP